MGRRRRGWQGGTNGGGAGAASFRAFVRDMGPAPEGHVLSVRDPRLVYSPANSEWVPRSERRWPAGRRAVMLAYRGEARSMAEWARRWGITRQAVSIHLRGGVAFAEMAERYEARSRGG